MLQHQVVGGHASVHDADEAAALGLAGAPIEGPTHFSQFDPLAVAVWGDAWFTHGCISSHFSTMVVEGEEVQATLVVAGARHGRIEATKADGSRVLERHRQCRSGSPGERARAPPRVQRPPGDLFIVDQLEVGMRSHAGEVSMSFSESNGKGYPFSLSEKLERITEPHPWYTLEGGGSSPWGRAIVPFEMVSVLASKSGFAWPVRSPVMGLFLDLEIRLLDGPVFVDQRYAVEREVVGLSQSRRTESYWTRTTLTDVDSGRPTATVLLHSGVFKESYPGYPKDRL